MLRLVRSLRERGQGTVELALFVPLMVIMIMGIFEVGIAVRNYMICEEAVRAGAVQASRGVNDSMVTETVIQNLEPLVNSVFMQYNIEDYEIYPTNQYERGQQGLVGVRLNVKSGFYLPFTGGAAFAVEYPFGAIRPVVLGLQTAGPEFYVAELVPWAMQEQTYVQGSEYILRDNGNHTHGNWGAVRLDSTRSGANDYEYDLEHGYNGTKSVGDVIETEPGNMKMPTLRAVVARFAGHQDEAWTDYSDPNEDPTATELSPRVILVPIIKEALEDLSGNDNVTIVGFARFFLNGIYANGAELDLSPGGPVFEADGRTLKSGWSSGLNGHDIVYSGIFLEDGLRDYEE